MNGGIIMLAALEYIFGDFWRFLSVCVFLMIFALWKPVEVNVMNGYWKEDDKDNESGV